MKRIFFVSLAICILVSPGYAQAPKDYPVKPITLIVAYEAGSSADDLNIHFLFGGKTNLQDSAGVRQGVR